MVPVLLRLGGTGQTSCFIVLGRPPRPDVGHLPRALLRRGASRSSSSAVGVSCGAVLAGLGPAGLAATETPASTLMRRTLGERGGHLSSPVGVAMLPPWASSAGRCSPCARVYCRHGRGRAVLPERGPGLAGGRVPRWWPSLVLALDQHRRGPLRTVRPDPRATWLFADWVFFGALRRARSPLVSAPRHRRSCGVDLLRSCQATPGLAWGDSCSGSALGGLLFTAWALAPTDTGASVLGGAAGRAAAPTGCLDA